MIQRTSSATLAVSTAPTVAIDMYEIEAPSTREVRGSSINYKLHFGIFDG